MITEEKMIHIVHLVLDGIKKAGLVDYESQEKTVHEAKKICLTYMNQVNAAADAARQRISTQKNPPLEGSPQWEVLYNKYFEEEAQKRGG